MRILLLLACMAIGFHSEALTKNIIHVSARTGSDESGDGRASTPFRSITRALATLDPSEAWETGIRLDYGTYGPAFGETLPLNLPPGLRLEGLAAGASIVDGEGSGTVIRVAMGEFPVVVQGITIQNGEQGIQCTMEASKAGALVLNGVQMKALKQGLDLSSGATVQGATLAVKAESLRVIQCKEGIRLSGDSPLTLDLKACLFSENETGIFLDGNGLGEKGVDHSLTAEDCIFQNHKTAGVLRRGDAGTNRSSMPYVFKECLFLGNHVGLLFERPGGDSPLELIHCSFLENTLFGIQIVGSKGDANLRSRIVDCAFRWNGVGMQLISTQVFYEIRRNRITDNLGNGVFCGNVLADLTILLFTDNLIANNGATGIYCLSDGRRLKIYCVNNTIVDNGDFGLRRHNKHGGESAYEIRNSIFGGNKNGDLTKVGAKEVSYCLLASGRLSEEDLNFPGDPGFADWEAHDYRLRGNSPCRDQGKDEGLYRAGAMDLDGRDRRVGNIDIGAFEFADSNR